MRKNVEHNCTELICPLLLLFEDIQDYSSLINNIYEKMTNKNASIISSYNKIKFNNEKDFENYVKDMTHKK